LLVPNRPVRKFIAPTRLVPRQTPSDTSHDLCTARHTDISPQKSDAARIAMLPRRTLRQGDK
jgi:hypothetical protein